MSTQPLDDAGIPIPTDDPKEQAEYFATLIKKLGFAIDDTVVTIGEPDWYTTDLVMHGIENSRTLPATWVHIFSDSADELRAIIDTLDLEAIEKGLWISWPKKSSKVHSTLTEDTLRDILLPLHWVDIKVCAIDQTWSALKFVRRKDAQ